MITDLSKLDDLFLSPNDDAFINHDCMDGMKRFPDKFFDLAIVDPPYGDGSLQNVNVERERERERTGLRGGCADFTSRKRGRFGGRFDKYHINGDTRDGRQILPLRETGYL